ncbi:sigma-70 family RNA polymerase sigma factor [Candidatus Parcubacteria bacterium]|nr:sigma-70 family RNA polymerase sigma factor [Candidatus Parcubacteria bacterium]
MINKKFKKFPKEKDLELSRRFKEKNDKYALNQLVEINMWTVKKEAYKFTNRGVELYDLFQAGVIGLIIAAKKFDHTRGCRLSTYAGFWIKAYIVKEIKKRNIHIPSHIQEDFSNICKTKDFLEKKLEREASLHEISDETGVSVEKIEFIYKKMNLYCTSLDAPIKYKKSESSGSKSKSEVIGDISFSSVDQLLVLKEELSKTMKIILNAINQFPKENKNIFCKCLGLNENFQYESIEEIATEFSCSESNIRQHIKRSFNNLYFKLKKNGYEIQKDRIEAWLAEKIYLCYWLQETTGANFSILK